MRLEASSFKVILGDAIRETRVVEEKPVRGGHQKRLILLGGFGKSPESATSPLLFWNNNSIHNCYELGTPTPSGVWGSHRRVPPACFRHKQQAFVGRAAAILQHRQIRARGRTWAPTI